MRVLKIGIAVVILGFSHPSQGLSLASASSLADYTGDAVGPFNNMRAPASFIGGSIVPLGILSAPTIQKSDSKLTKAFKKANLVIAIASLVSEVLAVIYSSIAINKLTEITQPKTSSVAELLSMYHELPWVGANVHFFFGLLGFATLAGAKAYFMFGPKLGTAGVAWAGAGLLQALSVLNKGIAMGSGGDACHDFATNFFGLIVRYVGLVVRTSRGGVCSMAAVAVALFASYHTVKTFADSFGDAIESHD